MPAEERQKGTCQPTAAGMHARMQRRAPCAEFGAWTTRHGHGHPVPRPPRYYQVNAMLLISLARNHACSVRVTLFNVPIFCSYTGTTAPPWLSFASPGNSL